MEVLNNYSNFAVAFLTLLLVLVTIAYAVFTRQMVKEMQVTRQADLRPYLIIDTIIIGQMFYLVIKNNGKTAAERVGFKFWICAGCDSGTLEETYDFDITNEDYGSLAESTYYPVRTGLHVEGKKFRQLPKKLNKIYRETLQAYNNDLTVLCALGIRALIEGICADKSVTGRNCWRSPRLHQF